jgi:hypothetical protein
LVHAGEVEAALLGFDLLPVDRDLQRIAVEELDRLEGRLRLGGVVAAGVAGLPAHGEERPAPHSEHAFHVSHDRTPIGG